MRTQIKDSEMISKRFNSKYGFFTIVKEIEEISRHKRFLIKFDEYNGVEYSCIATKNNILNNRVKNPYFPYICNVAHIGEINLNGKMLEYGRWKMMINRCYNVKNKDFKTYGETGITVCERWFSFANYYNDFSKIEGYNRENLHNLVIDKDIKSIDCKEYNLENCKFVSVSTNAKEASIRTKQKEFIAVSPEGKIYKSNNQREFAMNHNLSIQALNNVLSNRSKTHKGWKFKYTIHSMEEF